MLANPKLQKQSHRKAMDELKIKCLPSYNLGKHYGERFAHENEYPKQTALFAALVRANPSADDESFKQGFYAGWDSVKTKES